MRIIIFSNEPEGTPVWFVLLTLFVILVLVGIVLASAGNPPAVIR